MDNRKKVISKVSTAGWKMIGVRMPPRLVKALKQHALDNDTSMQDITIEALRDLLKRHGVKVPTETVGN